MKIAITCQGTDLDSPVDPRFGRAANFLIVDTDTEAFQAVPNTQNLNAAQGAGIQSAQAVAAQDVEAVATGHVGPKAFRALAAAGITIYLGAEGTVRDALDAVKNGRLETADNADVEGHWV